jgi:hypothetical protein
MRIPGTVVAMGLYGPRISAGASGLRSQVSRWLGPPHNKMKMHDLSVAPSLFGAPTRAATIPGTLRFNIPAPPSWSNRRREIVPFDDCRLELFTKFLREAAERIKPVEHRCGTNQNHL